MWSSWIGTYTSASAWLSSYIMIGSHRQLCDWLHCALAAAQCIVIGPVWWVCLFVCGSVTTITRNCVHRSSANWVLGKGSDHLQLTKFSPSCAPGKGSAAGRKSLARPYYSQQRAVFASLWALFSLTAVSLFARTTRHSVFGGWMVILSRWHVP